MTSFREYNGSPLSKKEFEWVTWFLQGTDDWWNAYGMYKDRRSAKRLNSTYERTACTWFNSVLKKLQAKGLFQYVPFCFTNHFVPWRHPGFPDSAEVEAITLHLQADEYAEFRRPLI